MIQMLKNYLKPSNEMMDLLLLGNNLKRKINFVHSLQLFQGVVSNCKENVLSSTYGNISTNADGYVSGSIGTRHNYYTTFDIGEVKFKCSGEYPFRDGDKVILYASLDDGYFKVQIFKNFTRNIVVEYPLSLSSNDYFDAFVGAMPLIGFSLIIAESRAIDKELAMILTIFLGGGVWLYFVLASLKKLSTYKFLVSLKNAKIENYPEFE